jgi:hypothetical protein
LDGVFLNIWNDEGSVALSNVDDVEGPKLYPGVLIEETDDPVQNITGNMSANLEPVQFHFLYGPVFFNYI